MQIQTFHAGHVPNLLAIRFLPISPTLSLQSLLIEFSWLCNVIFMRMISPSVKNTPMRFLLVKETPSLKAGTSSPAYFWKTRYLLVSSGERSLLWMFSPFCSVVGYIRVLLRCLESIFGHGWLHFWPHRFWYRCEKCFGQSTINSWTTSEQTLVPDTASKLSKLVSVRLTTSIYLKELRTMTLSAHPLGMTWSRLINSPDILQKTFLSSTGSRSASEGCNSASSRESYDLTVFVAIFSLRTICAKEYECSLQFADSKFFGLEIHGRENLTRRCSQCRAGPRWSSRQSNLLQISDPIWCKLLKASVYQIDENDFCHSKRLEKQFAAPNGVPNFISYGDVLSASLSWKFRNETEAIQCLFPPLFLKDPTSPEVQRYLQQVSLCLCPVDRCQWKFLVTFLWRIDWFHSQCEPMKLFGY